MSVNRVCISGNLTRDPELNMLRNGTHILRFGVAVNERRKNSQTGEWEDRPNFVDCVVFGQRAQSISNILRKGFKVAIDGHLRWSQWEDSNTGQKRSKLEVIADDIDFMSQRDGGYSQGNYNQGNQQHGGQRSQGNIRPRQSIRQSQPAPAPSVSEGTDADSYDIPF